MGKVWVLFPWLGWPRLTLVTPWHSVWTWASVPGPPPQPTTGNAFGAVEIYIELQTCSDQAPRAVLWLRRQAGAWPSLSIIVICPRGLAGKFSECRICQQWSPLVWIELGSAVIWHGILLTTSVIFCSDFNSLCLNIAFCIMVTVCLQIWFPSWTKFIMFGLGIQSPLLL